MADIGPSTTVALYRFCQNVESWDNLRTIDSLRIMLGKVADERAADMKEDAIALAYCRNPSEA